MAHTNSSGTQSPPLEATGEDKPMGVSSINSTGEPVKAVKDTEQRKQYLQSSEGSKVTSQEEGGKAMPEKLNRNLK